jgi:DNA replication and repair protein RecF
MLRSIDLTGFRNYQERHFDFDRVTVFVGRNGIGKTNVLEAIGFLALARSFRARQDREVIQWEGEAARIVGQTDDATIEIAFTQQIKGGKLIKINGINRRSIELLGHLMVVLFLPESLGMVAGAPQLRRQFLDLILIQEDRRYAYHLVQLQKVLRQRNKLLRQIDEGLAEKDQLAFWDETLAEHGGYVSASRVRLLQFINKTITAHYRTMSEREGELQLVYRAASVSESNGEQEQFSDPNNCPLDKAEWTKLLLQSLRAYQYREIAAGNSLYGPQRDDFVFMLDGRPLATFGSRGEFRSAILALKASEADFLLACNAEREQQIPLVFLLDDVYSELDEHRRAQLVKLIGEHQAVITTTDLSHLGEEIQKEAKVVELIDGS